MKFFSEFVKLIRIGFSFIPGLWEISKLRGPMVSIFGGTALKSDHKYAKDAYSIARKLVEHNFSVITGGGPGIMEAANCGAASVHKEKKGGWTLGIGVCGINGGYHSLCSKVIWLPYFFIRKWFLIRYSAAYIIFPGGIGTVDELFETFNLLRHKKIPSCPVILVGEKYWSSLFEWYNHAKEWGLITPDREAPYIITDDISKILNVLLLVRLRH